jgi:predicted dehydrogenase
MTFKVGLVGCGDIAGWTYLPGTLALRGTVDIVATCDVVPERARSAAEEYGGPGCRVHTSLEQLLADPDVEGVEVLTPWTLHYEMCLAALQAGKHVYVQKPMCQTLQEADRLVEEAERRGVLLMAAPPSAVDPIVQRIGRLVREGAVGKVALVAARSSHSGAMGRGRLTDSQWFFMREAGRWTSLVDMGVYGLHTVTAVLGPARRVSAFSGIAYGRRTFFSPERPDARDVDITAHDNGVVLLDWGEGTVGTVDGGFTVVQPEGPSLVIHGSRGVISQVKGTGVFRVYQKDGDGAYPQGWSVLDASGAVLGEGDARPSVPARGPRVVEDGRPVSGQLRGPAPDIAHWAECVGGGAEPILSAAHARHVVEIMEKAAQSSVEGRALALTTTFPDVIRSAQAVG